MNIIERMQKILQNFPRISEVCGEIHIDFAEPHTDSYGLSSMGDSLIGEDVCGNQTRQHTFMLYTVYSGINDYERLHNASALLELAQWLETQTGDDVESMNRYGTVTAIRAENGMLYEVPTEENADRVQYQLQIIAEYTAESLF